MESKTNNRKIPAWEMRDYAMTLTLTAEDFFISTGRPPSSQEEFDTWARLLEKGLRNGHLDWDILYECATDALADVQAEEVKMQTTGAADDA